MDTLKLEATLDKIASGALPYSRDAYRFLNDALKFTLDERKKKHHEDGHIRGPVLLDGLRRYALKRFGPMVPMVFEAWGVRTTEDFGRMVFQLIDAGFLKATHDDSMEDFKEVFDFHAAFVLPFQPATAAESRGSALEETPLRSPA